MANVQAPRMQVRRHRSRRAPRSARRSGHGDDARRKAVTRPRHGLVPTPRMLWRALDGDADGSSHATTSRWRALRTRTRSSRATPRIQRGGARRVRSRHTGSRRAKQATSICGSRVAPLRRPGRAWQAPEASASQERSAASCSRCIRRRARRAHRPGKRLRNARKREQHPRRSGMRGTLLSMWLPRSRSEDTHRRSGTRPFRKHGGLESSRQRGHVVPAGRASSRTTLGRASTLRDPPFTTRAAGSRSGRHDELSSRCGSPTARPSARAPSTASWPRRSAGPREARDTPAR